MAYRSLGTGWKKAILLNSHFLTDNSCTSVEIARRQTGTVRSISQIEHRTAKNEADERESKCLARHVRRPESVQQTGLCQLSLSGAHWCCSCLRANKAPCSDMQNVFHTSFHIKEIKQEDIQWSLNHLICKRPLSIKNGTLIKTFLSKVYHITCEFFYITDYCFRLFSAEVVLKFKPLDIMYESSLITVMPCAAGSLSSTLKMAGTCLGATAVPLCTLHIYVLIALQPARSINVVLFQLLEWQKYEMFPVSSGVYLFVQHGGCRAILQKTGINKKLHHHFPRMDCKDGSWKHFELHLKTSDLNLGGPDDLFFEQLILTLRINDCVPPMKRHWSGLHLLHHPRQSELKLWTKRMESNVPKASWQEMSRRDMHLQRPSHRQGFVGRFLLCAMAALCQGLLPPPEPPLPKHPKKKIRPFCQSEGWHRCCTACNPLFMWGFI